MERRTGPRRARGRRRRAARRPRAAHARASASRPADDRAPVSKSTADTSTALVRSSTASARRSASVSAGCAGRRTTSSPASPSRASWRRSVWNSPSVLTSRGRARRSRAESRRMTSSWVFAPRAISPPGSPSSAPEAGPHLVGLGERPPPLLVHVARGVVEGLDVALERDVRPRLVRVPGEQQPLGDAEARVVARERVHSRRAHRPQVGEGRRRRASCAGTPRRTSRPCPALSPIVRSTIFTWR